MEICLSYYQSNHGKFLIKTPSNCMSVRLCKCASLNHIDKKTKCSTRLKKNSLALGIIVITRLNIITGLTYYESKIQ